MVTTTLWTDGLIVYVGYILGLYRPVYSIAGTLIPRLRVLGSLVLGFLFLTYKYLVYATAGPVPNGVGPQTTK